MNMKNTNDKYKELPGKLILLTIREIQMALLHEKGNGLINE